MRTIRSTGNGEENDTVGKANLKRAAESGGKPAVQAAKMARLRERGNIAVMNHNRHFHCASCRKGRNGKDGCRYAVPFVHNLPATRLIQLGKRKRDDEFDNIETDDVRWCKACVADGQARSEPFTEADTEAVGKRIASRGLHYERVDVDPAPLRLPARDASSAQAALDTRTVASSHLMQGYSALCACPP